ncbi:hypothetical protein MPOCJGCO_2055 [Methylobacterium trifolii]|uniref:Uncharacterized protein n=1 Tax=Methylobacterium trifolii TaxID=1003092 RepID=A0ABQ4U0U0_9HYPH|nr:hypothetical protein MPOCJGCO_2055 [Methylobacterium trifolii]
MPSHAGYGLLAKATSPPIPNTAMRGLKSMGKSYSAFVF